jgi:hypothetical protein
MAALSAEVRVATLERNDGGVVAPTADEDATRTSPAARR